MPRSKQPKAPEKAAPVPRRARRPRKAAPEAASAQQEAPERLVPRDPPLAEQAATQPPPTDLVAALSRPTPRGDDNDPDFHLSQVEVLTTAIAQLLEDKPSPVRGRQILRALNRMGVHHARLRDIAGRELRG